MKNEDFFYILMLIFFVVGMTGIGLHKYVIEAIGLTGEVCNLLSLCIIGFNRKE